MKQPYEMTRAEFDAFREDNRSNYVQARYTKTSGVEALRKINNLIWLSYGVGEWLGKKALAGDRVAMDMIIYGYSLYDQVIAKRKEEINKNQ